MRQDREWQHGGDDIATTVDIALTTAETFEAATVRFGVPSGEAVRSIHRDQTVVVRVTWSGHADAGGSLQLMMMDTRVTPPRPLGADGSWTADGAERPGRAGAYDVLPEHYDWMQGFRSVQVDDNSWKTPFSPGAALLGAGTDGTSTAWFGQWGEGTIPLRDPTREIALALVRAGIDGKVHWPSGSTADEQAVADRQSSRSIIDIMST